MDMNNELKICTKCKQELNLSKFHKDSTGRYGVSSRCKKCRSAAGKLQRQNNPEHRRKRKEYWEKWKNTESGKKYLLEDQRRRSKTESYKSYQKEYRERNNHTEEYKNYMKRYKRQWQRNQRKNNSDYILKEVIRSRIRKVLEGKTKGFRTMELVGCTGKKLREYLESKFTNGMTWENRGRKGWELDHIVPCSIFDLSNPKEQQQCFHYTNLQPLWGKDNLKKRANTDRQLMLL